MSVVIVGTLDTKGEEIGFARDVLEAQGVDVHVVDVGVMGDPEFDPDTTASEVAEAAGTSLAGDHRSSTETASERKENREGVTSTSTSFGRGSGISTGGRGYCPRAKQGG